MWRVQLFVGRILGRCCHSHSHPPLRLAQSHHVEDEVISNTSVLSSSKHAPICSSQQGEDGEKRRRRRTSQFCFTGLPRYTALDAMGWGAAAVLVLQICKRIHSQLSSPGSEFGPCATPGQPPPPAALQRCGYRVLLEILSRRDVLSSGRRVSRLWRAPEIQAQGRNEDSGSDEDSSSSQDQDHPTADSSSSHQQGAGLGPEPSAPEESPSLFTASPPEPPLGDSGQPEQENDQENDQDVLSAEERLAQAALNLRQVAHASVPVALNIIGLESARSGALEAAFTCFLAAARHGYSKAQFNTGVCYEKGRGVSRDRDKALHFYLQAAMGGHSQAQYRSARLLLGSRGQQSAQDLDSAISLLEQASSAGVTQAQLFLGTLFSQEPIRDGRKSVHYLQMAAESGDGQALLFLGQCYETGFGVPQSARTAVRLFRQAAQAGNSQAQSLLTLLSLPPAGPEEISVLRSIRSAPCLTPADARLRRLLSDLAGHAPAAVPSAPPPLPHSWSTGSIGAPLSSSSIPLHLHPHTESAPCRWTIGVG